MFANRRVKKFSCTAKETCTAQLKKRLLNEEEIHMEAHIDFNKDIRISEFDILFIKIEKLLHKDFGINHLNLQPEYNKEGSKDLVVQD